MFISTESDAGAAKWGRVWVDYEVELFTPQPPKLPLSTGGARIQFAGADVPTITGDNFHGTGIITDQDIANPLIEAINNVSLNSTQAFKFLRDWSGYITAEYNSTSSGVTFANGLNAPTITGKGTVFQPPTSRTPYLTLANGAASFLSNSGVINGLKTSFVKAFAGDIIGLGSGGLNALSGLPANAGFNYFLAGN